MCARSRRATAASSSPLLSSSPRPTGPDEGSLACQIANLIARAEQGEVLAPRPQRPPGWMDDFEVSMEKLLKEDEQGEEEQGETVMQGVEEPEALVKILAEITAAWRSALATWKEKRLKDHSVVATRCQLKFMCPTSYWQLRLAVLKSPTVAEKFHGLSVSPDTLVSLLGKGWFVQPVVLSEGTPDGCWKVASPVRLRFYTTEQQLVFITTFHRFNSEGKKF